MIGEVVQRPLAAVLDPGREVTGQARLEGAQLAAQVIQVAGRVHAPDRTVRCGANPTVVATGEETVMSAVSEPAGRGAAWTEERATKEGGASPAPPQASEPGSTVSEPEGRGAAWTEERVTKERATREGGASTAPRRRARKHSAPEGRGTDWTEERATKERVTREGRASEGGRGGGWGPAGAPGSTASRRGAPAAWPARRARYVRSICARSGR